VLKAEQQTFTCAVANTVSDDRRVQ
jgi:hypothetical protein